MKRFWGEEIDHAAAAQLGLDNSHTIFMMASEGEHVDDLDELAEKMEDEISLLSPTDMIDEIKTRINKVKLPDGFRVVGMKPVDKDEPKTYGVVNLGAHGCK